MMNSRPRLVPVFVGLRDPKGEFKLKHTELTTRKFENIKKTQVSNQVGTINIKMITEADGMTCTPTVPDNECVVSTANLPMHKEVRHEDVA